MKRDPNVDVRHMAATVTAVAAFIAGWGLTIAGFIVEPTGEVSDSVLWILGQALIYAASVFGITQYFNTRLKGFEDQARRYIDDIDRAKSSPAGQWDDQRDDS